MTASDATFIFIVTGEPSGDALGGALIAALRQRTGGRLRVAGIGGERMREQGLESLVPLGDLAIMGVAEVLPRAPVILRRVRETVAAICAQRPDAVVTIDSSGFSWRVAHGLRRRGETLPLIHYVAPMVWAWRAGRARRMARWYDHLMTLLPFEPPYFERVGLSCSFVGHPVLECGAEQRRRRALPRDAWSRSGRPADHGIARQPRRRGPAFAADLRRGAAAGWKTWSDRSASSCRPLRRSRRRSPVRSGRGRETPIIVQQPQEKYDAFAASRAALAASGSVALELALARLPMVVGYRLNPLTEAFLDRVLKVRQVNLVNLLLGRPLVCELLGPNCTPERLAASLAELIGDERVRAAHRQGYDEAVRRLAGDGVSPSLRAADQILELVAARRCGISGSTARRSAR